LNLSLLTFISLEIFMDAAFQETMAVLKAGEKTN
jgi:hypothetical protein